jgi:type 1 glutamine amidotransferase
LFFLRQKERIKGTFMKNASGSFAAFLRPFKELVTVSPRKRPLFAFTAATLIFQFSSTPATSAAIETKSEAKSKKIVLIADRPDGHAKGTHEYERGVRLLKHCLDTSPNVRNIQTEAWFNGWPDDPHVLDDASTILFYTTGSDKGKHPLLQGDRLQQLDRLMKRGVGLVCLHYTLYVDNQPGGGGPEFLEWIGGYNDYQSNYSTHTVTEKNPPPATPATSSHPVARGWKQFATRNEFYIRQRFRTNDSRLVPILTTMLPVEKPERQIIAWAVERADGGRGFGFTGGHFHSNWFVEDFRRMVLNAIIWTAKLEVPSGGVQSSVSPDEFGENSPPASAWKSLFDGKTLSGWKITDFAGQGGVAVENGQLMLHSGALLTGVSWTNEIPKTDYEVTLDAMKVDGGDFFCGFTFPVGESFATFIVGGWGGGVVGLSSIDGQDASENETTKYMRFEKDQWYHLRVRVTKEKIETWIDEDKMAGASIVGRKISLRPGDIELSVPFGLATWQTTGALRNIKIRRLEGAAAGKAAP